MGGEDNTAYNSMLVNRFVSGLGDTEISRWVHMKRPENLETALEIAREMEAFELIQHKGASKPKRPETVNFAGDFTNQINAANSSDETLSVLKQIVTGQNTMMADIKLLKNQNLSLHERMQQIENEKPHWQAHRNDSRTQWSNEGRFPGRDNRHDSSQYGNQSNNFRSRSLGRYDGQRSGPQPFTSSQNNQSNWGPSQGQTYYGNRNTNTIPYDRKSSQYNGYNQTNRNENRNNFNNHYQRNANGHDFALGQQWFSLGFQLRCFMILVDQNLVPRTPLITVREYPM